MAAVYRGTDEESGCACAIKVLHAELGARADIRELFAKEARIGEVMGPHPNVVHVLDAGVDPTSQVPFIVMELLEGETLEEALLRGPLLRTDAEAVLLQLGAALDHAHAAGVVHRDLKPSNLFLVRADDAPPHLKVMDFGIAKLVEAGAVRTATQIGTPAYTAPEQLGATTRRLAAKQGIAIARGVSPATDVWALGLIAYEMFTGEAPGQYWRFETLAELPVTIAFEDLALASERAGRRSALLPPGFDAWFARCLEKDAGARWSSAGDAVRALLEPPRSHLTTPMAHVHDARRPNATVKASPTALGSEVELPPIDLHQPGGPSRRHRLLVGTSAAVLGLALLGAFVAGRLAPRDDLSTLASGCGVPDPNGLAGRERTSWLGSVARAGCPAASCDAESCVTLATALRDGTLESTDGKLERHPNDDLVDALLERTCSMNATSSVAGVRGCVALGRRRRAAGEQAAAKGYFDAACRAGVVGGCVALGASLLDHGTASASDEKAARALFERACDADDLDGCVRLGRLVERGRGGWQRDEAQAAALYRRACDGGTGAGCVALGRMLEQGRGDLTRDAVRGADLESRACDAGEPDGCADLARHLLEGTAGRPRDERRSYTLNREACERGSALGCSQLGRMYLAGSGGLSPDRAEGESLLRRACEGREVEACNELASLMLTREPPDRAAAESVLALACDAEPGPACVKLGELLLLREPTGTIDRTRAAHAYERACDAEHPRACTELANLVYDGDGGIPRDPARSAALNERACRGGDAVGCVRLAILMTLGQGTSRDLTRASSLHRDACGAPIAENQARCAELTRLLDEARRRTPLRQP
jgi:serine/threonine protein kinase/TPR repeat protein